MDLPLRLRSPEPVGGRVQRPDTLAARERASAGRHLSAPGGAPPTPRPRGRALSRLRPLLAYAPESGGARLKKPAVSLRVAAAAAGTVELGPPFVWEFCGLIGSAVTSQRAGPAAAMVAKDYPFYLTVKRANCSLEVPPASSPAKDAEVGPPPGPLWASLTLPTPSLGRCFPPLALCSSLSLRLSYTLVSPSSPLTLVSLSLPPFHSLSVGQKNATSVPVSLTLALSCILQSSQTVDPLHRGTFS